MNSLARLMAERDLDQSQVARMSGVSRETICKVASNRIKITKAANVAALAWALDVDPRTLVDIYRGKSLPVGGSIRAPQGRPPSGGTCGCGTHLSKSNPGRECMICERARLDGEVLDDMRARQIYAMRQMLGVYTRPHLFDSPTEFLQALTPLLDRMARLAGKELGEFPWVNA